MKNYSLFLLLVFSGCFCLAQTSTPAATALLDESPKHVFRLSLAHWLDPLTPGPHIAYEHQIKTDIYLRHEIGLFFDFNFADQASLQSLSGFRLRTGSRKYKSRTAKRRKRIYREVAVDFRYSNASVNGDFGRRSTAGGIFNQRIDYGIKQYSLSIDYFKGANVYLGENWEFDLAAGLGIRTNYRNYSGVPDDAFFQTNGSLFWQHNSRGPLHFTLSAPIIIALGYHF